MKRTKPSVSTTTTAELCYTLDDGSGIQRCRRGRDFVYRGVDGTIITARDELARIQALAIPPAWTSVWICPSPYGHLQATGRDARGRKQYRYHPAWRRRQDETKYLRLAEFGACLKEIRRHIDRAFRLPGLPREKILAAAIHLLDMTGIRVGNTAYTEANGSFGLTTLRTRHAQIEGTLLRLQFRGKSGLQHDLQIRDARLARIIRRCSELPGQPLLQYLDEENQPRCLQSTDVNQCLREWSGGDFTAKDFRTWTGSVHFLRFAGENCDGKTLVGLVKKVAGVLRNTPTVCRKYYIHPTLIEGYERGDLSPWIAASTQEQRRLRWLDLEEALLLKWLRRSIHRSCKAA